MPSLYPIPKDQEKILAWSLTTSISWASTKDSKIELDASQKGALAQATGTSTPALHKAILVVGPDIHAPAQLTPAAEFYVALKKGQIKQDAWYFDPDKRTWLRAHTIDFSQLDSGAHQPSSASGSGTAQPTPSATAPSSPQHEAPAPSTPQPSSSDSHSPSTMLPEIIVYKDEKQHLFYSLKHLKLRIESGHFSYSDWGWDEAQSDWIPLSDLVPKVEPVFAQEESGGASQTELNQLKERIALLEGENATLRNTNARLRTTTADSSKATLEKVDLRAENELLQTQLQDSQRREAQARREFENELSRQKAAFQTESEEQQVQISRLQQSLADFQKMAERTERSAEEKSDSLKASQMARKQLENIQAELESEREELRKQVRSLEADLSLERANLAESVESANRLKNQLDELRQSEREARLTIDDQTARINQSTHESEIAAAEIREHQERLKQLSEQLDKTIQRITPSAD